MKILIVGAGSIGRRHAKNVLTLGHKACIVDINTERAEFLSQEVQSSFYKDTAEAVQKEKDIEAAIISTPSIYHKEDALFLARKGIHILIEKPLAVKIQGLGELLAVASDNKIVTMMGQSYRFHEGFLKLKEIIDSNKIGKLYHVNFYGGQDLRLWHPEQDYRKEYSAQKKLGGGVMFTSMSHNLDTIEWLFGAVVDYTGFIGKLGKLEIDVDDSAFLLIKTEKNIIVYCQYDFLESPLRYQMLIVGEKGHIEADFIKHEIIIRENGKKEEKVSYIFDQNRRYLSEVEYFVSLVKNNILQHGLDIAHGKHVVDLMTDSRVKNLMIK